ncbi:MAG: oxygenase MpaB family protein [Betaproteobacteria bacterium]
MTSERWTDAFLDGKRLIADSDYDKRAEAILGATYLDVGTTRILDDWLAAQRTLVEDLKSAVEAGTAAAGSDGFRARQNEQHDGLRAWRAQVWPIAGWQSFVESTYSASLLGSKALLNDDREVALSAMRCALEYAQLLVQSIARTKAATSAGAQNPDGLRELSVRLNRGTYYRMLQISDEARRSPDIFACDSAFRKAQFRSYPDTLHDSFTPPHCPHWVDQRKLKTGFKLWREHMPGCVFALFTHSLPACYLDAKGIPLLYRSERLQGKFLAHRVYETGFFVKDVMDEEGIKVIEDRAALDVLLFAAAVHKVRPDLRLELVGVGLDAMWRSPDQPVPLDDYWTLIKDDAIKAEFAALQSQYAESPGSVLEAYEPGRIENMRAVCDRLGIEDLEGLFRHSAQPRVELTVRRLWGAGVLTATKVRYLHASMRFMARSDTAFQKDYPIDVHGEPINQEDKAFTLLTISYVIPGAYEKIGGMLSREEKDAFLHCWNVIGYVMGIDEDLLAHDWDEAKALYEKILRRHKARSNNGMILTSGLCELIEGLLPRWLPLREAIAPVLIRHQLDGDADLLFDDKTLAASRSIPVRAVWSVALVFLRVYFLSRHFVFDHIPAVRALLRDELRNLGNGMIECFQQTYERQRFELFSGLKGYDANPGTTTAEDERRADIRSSAYNLAALGVVLIVLLPTLIWIGLAGFIASFYVPDAWPGQLAKAMFWLGVVDVIGVGLAGKRLKAALGQLAFKVQRKALV